MPNVSSGPRRKTRAAMRKGPREKTTISAQLQEFNEGDRVAVTIDSAVHDGMPHPRFHGRTGTVVERRGTAYIIRVSDGNAHKTLIVHPAHLQPVEE